eukprot:13520047-Alexandrium_andersonii.AAC.1
MCGGARGAANFCKKVHVVPCSFRQWQAYSRNACAVWCSARSVNDRTPHAPPQHHAQPSGIAYNCPKQI